MAGEPFDKIAVGMPTAFGRCNTSGTSGKASSVR
jgi:hypothetical protein